jgi:hypothetical protein
MLIAEHFILIALDPPTGVLTWPRRAQAAEPLAAAALLLELAILHRLHLRDGLLQAEVVPPLSNQLLTEALHELGPRPLAVLDALSLVERRLGSISLRLMDGLYHRDILHRTASRWLPWQRARYPLRSVQPRHQAISHLHQALLTPEDMHGLALLMLTDATGLLAEHLAAREHEAAMQRLLALNDVDAQPDETHALFAAVRGALLA